MKKTNSGKVNIIAIIIVAIFLFIGLFTIGTFVVILGQGFREIKNELNVNLDEYDVTVDATIIDFYESETSVGKGIDSYGVNVYNPVYKYEYNNETYTSSGNISTSEKFYEIGDVTSVLISSKEPEKMYDPNFNAKSEYDSFKRDAFKMMIIPTIIGALIFFATIAVVVIAIRNKMANG